MVTRTYEVRTFGCQMNVHERIAGLLDEAGYAPVTASAQPDVVVFRTCAVRENADNKLEATSATSSRSRTARPACHPSTASSSFADRSEGRLVVGQRMRDGRGLVEGFVPVLLECIRPGPSCFVVVVVRSVWIAASEPAEHQKHSIDRVPARRNDLAEQHAADRLSAGRAS
jgi:hypothetical protein